jgi:hypothetical protein
LIAIASGLRPWSWHSRELAGAWSAASTLGFGPAPRDTRTRADGRSPRRVRSRHFTRDPRSGRSSDLSLPRSHCRWASVGLSGSGAMAVCCHGLRSPRA